MALASGGSSVAASKTTDSYELALASAQVYRVEGEASDVSLNRGDYSATQAAVAAPKAAVSTWTPPFVTPDPGTAQAIGYQMVKERGWGDDQFACLLALWNRESGWNVASYNRGSGAYGIAQALPGSKMASAGPDWATNPATQITWGLGYITGRYGSPCGAWAHSNSTGWY